jgi:hypothetical protein
MLEIVKPSMLAIVMGAMVTTVVDIITTIIAMLDTMLVDLLVVQSVVQFVGLVLVEADAVQLLGDLDLAHMKINLVFVMKR